MSNPLETYSHGHSYSFSLGTLTCIASSLCAFSILSVCIVFPSFSPHCALSVHSLLYSPFLPDSSRFLPLCSLPVFSLFSLFAVVIIVTAVALASPHEDDKCELLLVLLVPERVYEGEMYQSYARQDDVVLLLLSSFHLSIL